MSFPVFNRNEAFKTEEDEAKAETILFSSFSSFRVFCHSYFNNVKKVVHKLSLQ